MQFSFNTLLVCLFSQYKDADAPLLVAMKIKCGIAISLAAPFAKSCETYKKYHEQEIFKASTAKPFVGKTLPGDKNPGLEPEIGFCDVKYGDNTE